MRPPLCQRSTQPDSPKPRTSGRFGSRPARAGIGAFAAMAVVSACAGGVTGVKSQSLTTDVTFGLPPSASPTPFVSAAPAAPATIVAPPAVPAAAPAAIPAAALIPPPSMVTAPAPVTTTPVTTTSTGTNATTKRPTPAPTGEAPIVGAGPPAQVAAVSKCPVAPYGSSAKLLTIDVTTQPTVGSYREIYTSSMTVGSNMISTTNYLTMDVTNVSAVTSTPNPVQGGNQTVFTYDTVLHLADGALETTTYQVKNNSIYRNESAGNVGPAVAVGLPDRGVAIEKVVVTDKTGAVTMSSAFTPGVLQQPLPVDTGQTFTGEGVDTKGGTDVFDGMQLDVKHIDACGTLVDGYENTGTQVVVNGQTQSRTPLDVAYATNLGGLPIYTQGVDPQTGDTITLQLGQGTPSPLGTNRS